jgi:hypothetical protein
MKITVSSIAAGVIVALLCVRHACAGEDRWLLSADTWAQPRDGRSVSKMPPLPEVVAAWSRDPGQRLSIRYPGGEEGLLWAHELRSWLTALGIPIQDQELVAGSHQADRIEIELMTR